MQRVLVTGAGRRVGRAIVEDLAATGWSVAIHANASRADADDLAGAIRAAGGQAVAFEADLTDVGRVESLIDEASNALNGPLDALVNNASLFDLDRPDTMTAKSWDAHVAVNLRAPALLCRDFARQLPEGAGGCIVNLLDQKVYNLNPDFFSYTISKYALLGLTQTLAVAWSDRVRVCGVAPGLILPSANMSEATFRRMHSATPLGRGAEVDDVVAAVRLILETPGLDGQVITVDGGESLSWRARDVLFDPVVAGAPGSEGGGQ